MPSTYTDSLRFEEQGIGENSNTWGDKLNTSLDLIDKSIAGHISVSTSGGTTVLTSVNNGEDEARYKIIEITGTLGSNVIIEVPAVSKEYIVWDSTTRGGFTINFRLGGAGNTVAIPATTTRAYGISSDGTDWRPLSADLASETAPGIVEIATTAEAQAGSSNSVVLTPVRLQDVTATATRKGVIELATQSEVNTASDSSRAVVPSTLKGYIDNRTATTSTTGVVEKATTAEAEAGTANKFPDAAGVHSAIDYFFDFSNATEVFSGDAASVAMTSLSEQGPGLYIVIAGSVRGAVHVRDTSELTRGASVISGFAASNALYLSQAKYDGTDFECLGWDVSVSGGTVTQNNQNITKIYKV